MVSNTASTTNERPAITRSRRAEPPSFPGKPFSDFKSYCSVHDCNQLAAWKDCGDLLCVAHAWAGDTRFAKVPVRLRELWNRGQEDRFYRWQDRLEQEEREEHARQWEEHKRYWSEHDMNEVLKEIWGEELYETLLSSVEEN